MRLLLCRELRRQLLSIRAGFLFAVLVGFALLGIAWLAHRVSVGQPPFTGAEVGAFGAVSYLANEHWSGLAWTVVAGAFAGFGYVEDRVLGRTPYLLVRGITRRAHVVARVLSAALAPALITSVVALLAIGMACL